MFRLRRERQMEIEDDLWDKRKQEEEMEIARRKAEEEEAKANEPRQPLIQPLKLQTAKAKAEQLQPQAVAVKPAPAVPFPPIKVEAAPPVEKEPGVTSPVGKCCGGIIILACILLALQSLLGEPLCTCVRVCVCVCLSVCVCVCLCLVCVHTCGTWT